MWRASMPEERPTPERLLIVPRQVTENGEEARYLLVRWPDWPYAALLSIAPPGAHDNVEAAVASLLDARLHVSTRGPVILGPARIPVRMAQPRFGLGGTGWLRPVAVEVTGEPEADALLEGFEALTTSEALAALPTDVERAVFREGAALF
jgi:hypothetical protein